MDLNIKRKERKALNSSLYSSTHRNARTIKLVSLRVRRIKPSFFGAANRTRTGDLVLTKDVLYHLSHSSRTEMQELLYRCLICLSRRCNHTFPAEKCKKYSLQQIIA